MTIIAVAAILAAGGDWAAGQLAHEARFFGALVGGLLGLIAGFTAAYVRYRDL